jgi:cobalamin biosynthesis Mg chelatase CobN
MRPPATMQQQQMNANMSPSLMSGTLNVNGTNFAISNLIQLNQQQLMQLGLNQNEILSIMQRKQIILNQQFQNQQQNQFQNQQSPQLNAQRMMQAPNMQMQSPAQQQVSQSSTVNLPGLATAQTQIQTNSDQTPAPQQSSLQNPIDQSQNEQSNQNQPVKAEDNSQATIPQSSTSNSAETNQSSHKNESDTKLDLVSPSTSKESGHASLTSSGNRIKMTAVDLADEQKQIVKTMVCNNFFSLIYLIYLTYFVGP